MTDQLRLPGVDPPQRLRPAVDRPEPAVWLRRLQVLSALERGPEHVVRSVTLRRGLNIIWAPPKQPPGENALFRAAVASHTAGKTTLCRLIRFVVGEQAFASEATRRRIRDRFPSGWVLGEVFINGVCWTVARPFAVGAHPFAAPDIALEAVHDTTSTRTDFQAFLSELQSATLDPLAARRFPASDEPIRWDHLLPWLARAEPVKTFETVWD